MDLLKATNHTQQDKYRPTQHKPYVPFTLQAVYPAVTGRWFTQLGSRDLCIHKGMTRMATDETEYVTVSYISFRVVQMSVTEIQPPFTSTHLI